MAHYNHTFILPVTNASAFLEGVVLAGNGNEKVSAASTVNVSPVGLSIATVATYGKAVGVLVQGVGKAVLMASVGAWSRVGVGNASGALGPVTPSGAAVASGAAPAYSVGLTLKAGVAGDIVPVYVRPEQII